MLAVYDCIRTSLITALLMRIINPALHVYKLRAHPSGSRVQSGTQRSKHLGRLADMDRLLKALREQ